MMLCYVDHIIGHALNFLMELGVRGELGTVTKLIESTEIEMAQKSESHTEPKYRVLYQY